MRIIRKKRGRYPDQDRGRPSQIVPYVPDEESKERHKRRYLKNLENWTAIQDWAAENGFAFKMKNKGEHWILKREGFTAEWWPRTAKLVVNYHYRAGKHIHDWFQLFEKLDHLIRLADRSNGRKNVNRGHT